MFVTVFICNIQRYHFYSLDTLIVDEVCDMFYSKEKMKHLIICSKAQAEGLVIHEGKIGSHGRGRVKDINSDKVFWY